MKLPRFLSKLIPGFYVKDLKEWLKKDLIEIYLAHKDSNIAHCHRCGDKLQNITGTYAQKIQTMPLFKYKTFLILKRRKGHCLSCKKIRSEHLDFIAPETPHLTQEYSWWLGRMCEISAVSCVGVHFKPKKCSASFDPPG